MELVYCIQLFACTHKLDRLVHYRTDRKSGTTASITIELSQNDTVKIKAFIEFTSGIHCILTGHGVYHEQGFIRIDGLLDGFDFLHHLLVNRQTAGSIDNHQVIPLSLRFMNGIQGNLNRVLTVDFTVYGYTHLFAQHFQLFNRSRTIHVTSYQQRLAVLLGLEHTSQLTGKGCLTRTLQTRHQDNGRTTFQLEFGSFATHQLGQFVVYDLHHQLTWLHSCQYILAQRLFLHRISKVLGNLIVYVGIKQSLTYILQRFRYIDFGDLAFTFQDFERPFESFT